MMNGAQSLLRTLVDNDVDVCFTNPGTSEMHFVAALDGEPRMRAVLGLFEGVVTGAADGYARMSGRPAATLLHLGPGLGNGIANLHNARRAHTPIVNIVGDHATYHKPLDAPLESDIETLAANVSGWIRRSGTTDALGADAAEAVTVARTHPGEIATLILPADVSWSDGGVAVGRRVVPAPLAPEAEAVAIAAKVLASGEPAALLLGDDAVRDETTLALADAIAATTGAKVLAEVFPARIRRGAGIAPVERLGYLAEFAAIQLAGLRHLVLVGTRSPVSFFAYPGKDSDLVPEGCEVHVLTDVAESGVVAIADLADRVGASERAARLTPAARPERPTGALDRGGGLPGRRRDPRGRRDRRRRGTDRGHLGVARHCGVSPARLADPHRRLDRLRDAGRNRGRGGVSRSSGPRPPGRRERDVHAAVAVDPGT